MVWTLGAEMLQTVVQIFGPPGLHNCFAPETLSEIVMRISHEHLFIRSTFGLVLPRSFPRIEVERTTAPGSTIGVHDSSGMKVLHRAHYEPALSWNCAGLGSQIGVLPLLPSLAVTLPV